MSEYQITRSISVIAQDILRDWKKPHFAAVPYLVSMSRLTTLKDKIGCDTARDVVLRFLANASCWRGPEARRVKRELRGMLDEDRLVERMEVALLKVPNQAHQVSHRGRR